MDHSASSHTSRTAVGVRPERRFSSRYGRAAQLERLVIAVVDEPMVKLSALISGELDFAGSVPARGVRASSHSLAIREYPLIFPYALIFNTRRPPFNDPRARLAAALAIDRQEIVDGTCSDCRGGGGSGAAGLPGT